MTAEPLPPTKTRVSIEPAPIPDIAQHLEPMRAVDPRLIATGGMGIVRTAFDPLLERTIAIKSLQEKYRATNLEAQFFAEAILSASLEHPGIIPIYDLFTDEKGRPSFAMKHIEGETMAALLARLNDAGATLAQRLEASIEPLIKVCDTLAYAHRRGVYHGDIKPANILIGRFGEVYVVDWGVSRHGAPIAREVLGTPCYMPPERALGAPIDAQSDIFALGAILFEVLTRTRASSAGTIAEACDPKLAKIDRNSGCPELFVDVAMRALALRAELRHRSVAEFKSDLRRIERGDWHERTIRFAPGDDVCIEGESASRAFVIESGECEVFKRDARGRERSVAILRAGETFGELSLLTTGRRTASVRCRTEVELRPVSHSRFSVLQDSHPDVAQFIGALATRLHAQDEAELANRSAMQRYRVQTVAIAEIARSGGETALRDIIAVTAKRLGIAEDTVERGIAACSELVIDGDVVSITH